MTVSERRAEAAAEAWRLRAYLQAARGKRVWHELGPEWRRAYRALVRDEVRVVLASAPRRERR